MEKEKCDTKNERDNLCGQRKKNTSLEKEKGWGEVIENIEKAKKRQKEFKILRSKKNKFLS